jgi:hypothetical protein
VSHSSQTQKAEDVIFYDLPPVYSENVTTERITTQEPPIIIQESQPWIPGSTTYFE